jgi:hypothetical protein
MHPHEWPTDEDAPEIEPISRPVWECFHDNQILSSAKPDPSFRFHFHFHRTSNYHSRSSQKL